MVKKLDRRTVLRGIGGLTIGLPVLDAMLGLDRGLVPTARASVTPDGYPRRLLVFMTGFGYHDSTWVQGTGSTPSDFSLTPMLSPFAGIEDKCLFLEGADARSNVGRIIGHPGGMTSVLTGSYGPASGHCAGGCTPSPVSSSLDVRIDEALGQGSTYRWATKPVSNQASNCPFYSEPQGAHRVPQHNGELSFEDLFSDVQFGDGMDAELAFRLQKREKVYDLVSEDLSALTAKVGSEDRVRIEQHLAGVQALIDKTQSVAGGGAGCSEPEQVSAGWGQDQHQPAIWSAQVDQIATAFACDLIRAGFAMYGQLVNDDAQRQTYYREFLDDQPGVLHADRTLPDRQHHQISHLDTSGGYRWEMEKISHWHAMELRRLYDRLASIPEGDGTVMDHTTIVWMNEMGWDHSNANVRHVILGDGGGYFRTGQSIRFGGGDDTAHNRLLLNLLHYLGIEDQEFGVPRLCERGPFEEILA